MLVTTVCAFHGDKVMGESLKKIDCSLGKGKEGGRYDVRLREISDLELLIYVETQVENEATQH